jgi:enoyl-CoA hydratase/carnithine racemase
VSYEAILLEQHDGVATITLNRPDVLNAQNTAMRRDLVDAFSRLRADESTRVIVVTGAGERAFSAGADIREFLEPPVPTRFREERKRLDYRGEMDRCPQPIIAAIRGFALGGGLELALACDIRIAATGARFGLPEAKIGSLPGSGGTQRLAGSVGRSFAAQMLFTGELITAEQALAAGLVSEVLAQEALMERAWALARIIAGNAPLSLVAIKKAFRAATDQPLAAGFELERALYGALTLTEDRAEGRAAFREKRKPDFKGR